MKFRSVATLTAIVTLMLSAAMAAPRNKTSIRTHEQVTVGGVMLQPGEYAVEWNGTGPDVQVTFSQGEGTLATAPAILEQTQNMLPLFITRYQESGPTLLVEIDTKTVTLRFTPRIDSQGH